MPVTIRYGVPLAAAIALGRFAYDLLPKSIGVQSVGFLGMPFDSSGCNVQLYPFDDSGAAEYPPQALAKLDLDATGSVTIPVSQLGPDGAHLVVDSPTHGVVVAHVDATRPTAKLEFGELRNYAGVVLDSDDKPVAGARVQVLTHRYGCLVREGTSNAAGEVAIEKVSSSSTFFTVRTLQTGFTADTRDLQLVVDQPFEVKLRRTRPVEGSIRAPAELRADSLDLRAFRVPGVRTKPLADGGFYLDCLPMPPTEVRLVLGGLPPGFTHEECLVSAGQQKVEIKVTRAAKVRGVVVTADRDLGVPGAYVEHGHGPSGRTGVYSDSSARFEIDAVPPGRIRIEAFGGQVRRLSKDGAAERVTSGGFALVDVEEGKDVEGVVIRIQ